jgi:hypothetical protein
MEYCLLNLLRNLALRRSAWPPRTIARHERRLHYVLDIAGGGFAIGPVTHQALDIGKGGINVEIIHVGDFRRGGGRVSAMFHAPPGLRSGPPPGHAGGGPPLSGNNFSRRQEGRAGPPPVQQGNYR